MPIRELREFVVSCGGCDRPGGHWRDRVSADECVPTGWTFIEVSTDEGRAVLGGWYEVYCPECAPGILDRLNGISNEQAAVRGQGDR